MAVACRKNRRKVLFKGRLLWGLLFCLLVHLLHWHSGMAVVAYMRLDRRQGLFKGRLLRVMLFCLLVHLLHWHSGMAVVPHFEVWQAEWVIKRENPMAIAVLPFNAPAALTFRYDGVMQIEHGKQCWGSMAFRCGNGSADPYLWLSDPNQDPTSNPTLFFSYIKDANFLFYFFS